MSGFRFGNYDNCLTFQKSQEYSCSQFWTLSKESVLFMIFARGSAPHLRKEVSAVDFLFVCCLLSNCANKLLAQSTVVYKHSVYSKSTYETALFFITTHLRDPVNKTPISNFNFFIIFIQVYLEVYALVVFIIFIV